MIVGPVLHMDLHPGAQLSRVLVEGRLEPALPQPAPLQPVGSKLLHLRQQLAGFQVRCTKQLQRPGGAAPLGQGCALQHDRTGIAASHAEIGRVGAGVHPSAFIQWPAVARPGPGCPTLHGHHLTFHVQLQGAHKPQRQFTHGEAMTHRQRPRAHEALPARTQGQPLHRASRRIGSVQHHHPLVALRRRLQHIAQGGNKGVNAATQILQVHQQHVEAVHHGRCGSTYLAIQTEHRDAQLGIVKIRRLHHVVLLVAAQTMLGTEGGREPHVGQPCKGVQGMGEILCHRSRMRQQSQTTALQGLAQCGLLQQAVDSKLHDHTPSGKLLKLRIQGSTSCNAKASV